MLENYKWRYATKKFDPTKKISDHNLSILKESIQLAPSSYGLQLFKVLIIDSAEVRAKLKPFSWNQSQITDASHLLVFCNYNRVTYDLIDEFVALKAKAQNIGIDQLEGYGSFIKNKLSEKSEEEVEAWTSKQTYLALGNLLNTAADLKIDSCPMEGFEPAEYDKILNLSGQNLTASVVATIGYRSEEDKNQFAPKVRRPMDFLFETI